MAKEAYARFSLDEIWFLVSPHNPLKEKSELEDFPERVVQCQILTKNTPWCKVSTFEQDNNLTRTADTIEALQKEFPDTQFVWLMGSENWKFFHTWNRYQSIIKNIPIISFFREDDNGDYENYEFYKEFKDFQCKETDSITPAPQWRVVHIDPHKGRASNIRENLEKGEKVDDLTDEQISRIKSRQNFCINT